MTKRLVGTYVSIDDAMKAVEELSEQGYSRSEIDIIADRIVKDSIPFTMDAEVSTADEARAEVEASEDNRSIWEKVKDAFTFNEYDKDTPFDEVEDPLQEYRNDLAAGKIVVLVEEDDAPRVPPTDPLLVDDLPTHEMTDDEEIYGSVSPDLPIESDPRHLP